jgi:hypothetical protein
VFSLSSSSIHRTALLWQTRVASWQCSHSHNNKNPTSSSSSQLPLLFISHSACAAQYPAIVPISSFTTFAFFICWVASMHHYLSGYASG